MPDKNIKTNTGTIIFLNILETKVIIKYFNLKTIIGHKITKKIV